VFKVFLSLFKLEMLLFVILLLLSRVVKGIFTRCIVMSKQGMGIMTFVNFWTLWTIAMLFYINFGLINHLQGLNMQHFSFMGGVTCYISVAH
jgi:hypothetical protein